MVEPTPEQAEAVAAYGDGTDLVLQAGAGCGKSSTLRLIAQSDRRARMTYVAYNRAIANDAKRSFPMSATCSTAHGLAMAGIGRQYAHRLNGPRQTAHQAAQALDVPRILGYPTSTPVVINDKGDKVPFPSKKIMRTTLETVTRWCYSADPEVTARHIPRRPGLESREVIEQLADLVLPVARAAWSDLRRAEGGVLKFAHDHYLKMWQLGAPKLNTDVVLLDEGQDTNDVVVDVIQRQEHAQRIVVGDSAQQIYEWRGANDALAKFTAGGAQERTLSQSFRFGPAIAEAANRWLYVVGTPMRLTGFDPVASAVGPVDDPEAILCRTNSGAMQVVVDALGRGVRVALVGGGSDMKRLAQAAEALQQDRPVDHPELVGFPSWDSVRQYADEEADGADLRVLVDLIDEYGAAGVITAADALANEDQAELVVSTAHRSKGREWDRVRVHADFRAPTPDPATGLVMVRREEARLAYVAVTRARLRLDDSALSWLDTVHGVIA